MRHVPTCLYIDTEFFKRNGLRFDTKVFISLRDTFVKGGLRLLVPKIMERELLRHFEREAEKIVNAVESAHKGYHVKNLSLPELASHDELKAKCFEEMSRQWSSFKEHFLVENLPVAGDLDNVMDWYFETRPPFSEKKPKEFPDAFIISTLDFHHKLHQANIAVIGNDDDFRQACDSRRYILYFSDLEKYIEAFQPELSGEEILPGDVDLTRPITTEDLTELKAILGRGSRITSIEIERVFQLLKSRGSNYDYFFQNADDTVWLNYLSDRAFFLNPPNTQKGIEGHTVVPWWPPMEYLIRIFDKAPAKVMEIISSLPNLDNFRILAGILRIVLKADSVDAVLRFSRFIFAFVDSEYVNQELIVSLLNKPFIFDHQLSEFTPALLFKLVEFKPDPHEQEKKGMKDESPDMTGFQLEPHPRFVQWEYDQLFVNGIRLLIEGEPFQVARILIDAVASMIRVRKHQSELERGGDEDYSEVWIRRLDKVDFDHQDSKVTLVHNLAFACQQVYLTAPNTVIALDQALRNQRWKIFTRLRQHLYALNPNEQTLPWIQEFIFSYQDFGNHEYHYEFQLMLKKACEHFGRRLLNEDELTTITDAILSGPSKTHYREWMGERYSEELFQQRQHYFHRAQLRPFYSLLTGTVKSYYEELVKAESSTITDDSYSPIGESSGGFVSYRSPKSIAELESLTDEDLLNFINDWSDERRDSDDWLVEINIPALADVFMELFKSRIVPNSQRLSYWLAQRDRIKRPIYIAKIISVMLEQVKARDFTSLPTWIEFCYWLLNIADKKQNDDGTGYQADNDWSDPRREVSNFIAECIKKEIEAPISARDGIAGLLRTLITQADSRLDEARPVLLNRDDPITEAINNVRSRALEALINFGLWVRRQIETDPVAEVAEIISERIKPKAKFPLTRPEYAILGMHFTNLWIINPDWVIEQKESLFPTSNLTIWRDAFGSYIRFNQPNKRMFEVLREQHLFAMKNLTAFLTLLKDDKGFIDRLGQHIFTYYIWDVFPLTGEASLLEEFYVKTDSHHEYWARLFNHVGRSFKNSGKQLDPVLIERAISYFEWRFDAEEPSELQEFNFWLEAECFAAEWRLKAYLRILNFGFGKGTGLYSALKVLNKLLPEHQALVVECFAKITDLLDQRTQMHLSENTAKPILQSGLISEEPEVRTNAEHARENLLRLGRFDFLELD